MRPDGCGKAFASNAIGVQGEKGEDLALLRRQGGAQVRVLMSVSLMVSKANGPKDSEVQRLETGSNFVMATALQRD